MYKTVTIALLAAAAMTTRAEAAFTVTYEAPRVENSSAGFTYKGVENFDTRRTGNNQTFTTSFGTGGVINGTYSGLNVLPASQYGGAGGTGRFAQTESNGGYSLDLSTNDPRGINYFGYWLSALDSGNQVSFYKAGQQVFNFSPTDVSTLLGGNNAYFGNPSGKFVGQDGGEQFAFLNFFSDTSFDKVVFSQHLLGAAYESDNHTVGFFTTQSGTSVGSVPEPATWAMMIGGFGLVGAAMRRSRKVSTLIA